MAKDVIVKEEKKTALMNRPYQRGVDYEAEEAELEAMKAENRGEEPTPEPEEDGMDGVVEATDEGGQDGAVEKEELSAEEKSFKKRYADLRRHNQKQKDEFDKRLKEMEKQIKAATNKAITLPKSEEEVEEWAAEYPDVAKIIETIATKKALEMKEGLDEQLEDLSNLQRQTRKERAETDLLKLHPDFDEIRHMDEFHEWADSQPKWVQSALYDNDDDAQSTARAIDLFKADTEWGKEEPAPTVDEEKAAAEAVNVNGEQNLPNEEGGDDFIKESEIDALSTEEYEAQADLIATAIREGKVIYDISGAAR